jgi:hypothetical protein
VSALLRKLVRIRGGRGGGAEPGQPGKKETRVADFPGLATWPGCHQMWFSKCHLIAVAHMRPEISGNLSEIGVLCQASD